MPIGNEGNIGEFEGKWRENLPESYLEAA